VAGLARDAPWEQTSRLLRCRGSRPVGLSSRGRRRREQREQHRDGRRRTWPAPGCCR